MAWICRDGMYCALCRDGRGASLRRRFGVAICPRGLDAAAAYLRTRAERSRRLRRLRPRPDASEKNGPSEGKEPAEAEGGRGVGDRGHPVGRLCVHRGAPVDGMPRLGPCSAPRRCRHPATPPLVVARICGPGQCRYYRAADDATTAPVHEERSDEQSS